jgi:hypothetical protein
VSGEVCGDEGVVVSVKRVSSVSSTREEACLCLSVQEHK